MTGTGARSVPRARRATTADVPAIVALLHRALGWEDDTTSAQHFLWKHFDNPFGRSDVWVADTDDALVGVRCFLKWELRTPDGERWAAARSVDTATDADHRRQGVFTQLTTAGLDALRGDGVRIVFNTPNDQSRAANLSLGWEVIGRLRAAVRPLGLRGTVALLGARRPAARAAVECSVGEPARAVLGSAERARTLLDRAEPTARITTTRTPAYLAWRYGHPHLDYRLVDDGSVAAVLHLRRRGRALEAVLCDTFAPATADDALRRLVVDAARASGADYVLALAAGERPPRGFLPLPRTGPVLTARAVAGPVPADLAAWGLTMGDIEGF